VEESSEVDEEAIETIELVDPALLTSEDAVVGTIAALELPRVPEELPPADFPDLVALTEDS
jgi:hypothetical protein